MGPRNQIVTRSWHVHDIVLILQSRLETKKGQRRKLTGNVETDMKYEVERFERFAKNYADTPEKLPTDKKSVFLDASLKGFVQVRCDLEKHKTVRYFCLVPSIWLWTQETRSWMVLEGICAGVSLSAGANQCLRRCEI